ncbi:MAG: ATP-binding protein [Clostridiales bacterium]|nr:ATP-binding protein [Clostridiales bacterium]
MKIVGRSKEQAELWRYYHSGKPELIAVTGRRRIGKTFLIREMFSEVTSFYFSGSLGKGVSNNYQLMLFDDAIGEYGGDAKPASKNWAEAFSKLRHLLRGQGDDRKIVFIDELPWLDAPKSDFLPALDYFWNTFASARPDVMLIVCGSAASWIVTNLFESKGSLHNRVTGRLWLAPFTLAESEALLQENGVMMSKYQIAECQMVFGGVPYYLNMLEKGFGLTQNIDRLLFIDNAPLKNEFNEVHRSLFLSADRHMRIVEALSKSKNGMTRDEIIHATKIPGGGNLTKALRELEQCSFIDKYSDFTKPKNNAYYRLIDPFTLFWFKHIQGNQTKDEYYWTNLIDDGARRAWSGNAFELVCLLHISQIKKKLGISGISTEVFSWRSKGSHPGAQVDLLISRKDGVINLCEMKYTLHPLKLSEKDDRDLHNKRVALLAETGTKKAIHITMVTTYGLTDNGYKASVQSEVTLDDLFAE